MTRCGRNLPAPGTSTGRPWGAIDFFVLYSSATTLFGNEGQANYAAANVYLEALPVIGVAWGFPAWRSGGGRLPTSAIWPAMPR